MAGTARDRVTIDLRGIGDAVRVAAAARGVNLAAFARQALMDAAGPGCTPSSLGFTSPSPAYRTVKFTLRLRQPDAEALFLRAGALGLSYGEYVSRLVNGTPLPMPAAERDADRAALRCSADQLAVLSADLNDFVRLLRMGKSDQVEKYRRRIDSVDAEIRRHLDLASAFLAQAG